MFRQVLTFCLVATVIFSGCNAWRKTVSTVKAPVRSAKRLGRKSVSEVKDIMPFGESASSRESKISAVETKSGQPYSEGENFERMSDIVGIPMPSSRSSFGATPSYTTKDLIAAGDFQYLLMGRSGFQQRKNMLLKFSQLKPPQAEARSALEIVYHTASDPLAGLALRVLAAYGDAASRSVVNAALNNKRPDIRHEALRLLITGKDENLYKISLKRLQEDKNAGVRSMACLGLGISRDKRAAPTLRYALDRDGPQVKMAAAWALYVIGDPAGKNFLTRIAVSDDMNVSPAAIRVLSELPGPQALTTILKALGARNHIVWKTAFEKLLEKGSYIPAGAFDLSSDNTLMVAPNNYDVIRRRAALIAIARHDEATEEIEKSRYALLNQIASYGEDKEKILMAEVLFECGSARGIEPLIRCLKNSEFEVARICGKTLTKLCPEGIRPPLGYEYEKWREWWISQSHTKMVRDSRSGRAVIVVSTPDLMNYFAAPGAAIVPDVTVSDIYQEDRRTVVALSFNNRLYKLKTDN